MALKDRLNNLTGLQRAFLVAFLICWGYFAVWQAKVDTDKFIKSGEEYRLAMTKELSNPVCLPYKTKPLSELPDTDANFETQLKIMAEGCSTVHGYRLVNPDTKLPVTQEIFDSREKMSNWEVFFISLTSNTTTIFVTFALIFVAFKIGRWIFAGFKKTK